LDRKQAVMDEACVQEPASPVNAASGHSRDRSLVRSVAWNALSDWVSQIFSWASFLVVMRLLTPADFGIAAMAMLLVPYLSYLSGFGIQRAVVILRDLTDEQLAQLNTVSFSFGIACFSLAAILAKPFAAFFHSPRLAPVTICACIPLIPGGLQAVSTGWLAREMRFRLLSLIGAATAVVAAIVTLGTALLGLGYWALVIGNLVASLVRTVVVLRIRPCKLAWPHLNAIREPLGFGWRSVISMLALSSYQRLDNLVAGRRLGQSALGFYGTAWELAYVPIEKVTSLVTTVIPTYLAEVRNQPAALRRYLRGLTEMVALATFPATVGLGIVAPELVPLAFGRKWEGMIGPLEVLSFYTTFRSIVALLPKLLTAVGEVHFVMWNDLAALIILPAAFYLGSFRGTTGIAWAWVVVYPFVAIPLYRKTFRTIDMKVGEYFRALRPALEGTIVMIVVVELLKHGVPTLWPLPLRFAIEVTAGALAYFVTLRLLHRERLMALWEIARNLFPRGSRPRDSARVAIGR